ncbi:hypothetical protein GCM10027515_17510 [Schumannella luteola]|uniref:Uncharacterized protein n=1 Tax=Schumannella luteola TaxID=472059 RepID=A0A852YGN3_9MICO|nr:hypothetical protein [Schumannella luteola]NYH00451.1 hypothetical protein [Schumannella luteola]TPX03639.1 hypothetical protein FJ656_15810 [Schumannella luteola]
MRPAPSRRGAVRRGGLLGLVALAATALLGIGAAPLPAPASAPNGTAPAAFCIPILMDCSGGGSGSGGGGSTPSPSPSPGSPIPGVPIPGLPGAGSGGSGSGSGATPGTPTPPPAPADAIADPDAPVMTLPAAQLEGSSLSFTGLKGLSLVTVPLADGTRTPVLKLEVDSIAIDDFVLDVRHEAGGDALVTKAGRMELHGHVVVYLDSVSATGPNGVGLSLGAQTPLPGDELPPKLLQVSLGLVGVTGDRISFTPVHQYFG